MLPQGDLFNQLASFAWLLEAWRRVRRGAGKTRVSVEFEFNLEQELLDLRDELRSGTWKPAGYRYFTIKEPKERLIAAAPLRDRIVHHAVVGLLEPIYEERFIEDSYATRKGKGMHLAVCRAQELVRRHRWHLKVDIRQYFPSVDLDRLGLQLRQDIGSDPIIDVLERILRCDPSRPGLPIGNLTSQFLANVYLNGFDHWVQDELRPAGYVRYMDDMVFFHDDRSALKKMLPEASGWLTMQRGLRLKESATRINQRNHGLGFLGVRIFPELIRVRRESLRRCLQRLSRREWQYQSGWLSEDELAVCAQSAVAHLAHWNSHALRRSIFKGDHHRRLPSRQSGRRLHQCRGESARSQPRQQ